MGQLLAFGSSAYCGSLSRTYLLTLVVFKNPFRAGLGYIPPYMAGRDRELSHLRKCLQAAVNGDEPNVVLMVGPRGCGKTALLNWTEEYVQKHFTNRIHTYFRSKEIPHTQDAFALKILEDVYEYDPPQKRVGEGKVVGVGGSVEWGSSKLRGVQGKLRDISQSQPLAILVDELAATHPEGVSALFNVAQFLQNKSKHVLTVAAGTPKAIDLIRNSDPTFYDKSTKLDIGLISKEATRLAIEKPLRENGATIDASVLDAVFDDTEGYPLFVTYWAEALADRAILSDAAHIEMSHFSDVREQVARKKTGVYKTRANDWEDEDVFVLNDVLTETEAQRRTHSLTAYGLKKVVERVFDAHGRDTSDVTAFRDKILHTGFLWEPMEADHLILGLPSFANYVMDRVRGESQWSVNG